MRIREQVEVRQEEKLPEGSWASVTAHLPNKPLQLFCFWTFRSIQFNSGNPAQDNTNRTRREVESIWMPSFSCTGHRSKEFACFVSAQKVRWEQQCMMVSNVFACGDFPQKNMYSRLQCNPQNVLMCPLLLGGGGSKFHGPRLCICDL